MNILPLDKLPPSQKSPTKLFIFSSPKVGKTTACALLEDSLILDFEGGTTYLDARKIRVIGISTPTESNDVKQDRYTKGVYYLQEVATAIKEAKYPYKYIVVDTVTALEDMAKEYAKEIYKRTPQGKDFKLDSILHLPKGNGYQWLREAMDRICATLESLAPRIIYVGHLKLTSFDKEGKELNVMDVDLTGKIKSSMTSKADAIGLLVRKDNKVYISFKMGEDVIAEARAEHLANKVILLTEKVDGNVIAHWDSIYID